MPAPLCRFMLRCAVLALWGCYWPAGSARAGKGSQRLCIVCLVGAAPHPGARYCAHCGAPLEAPLWSGAATLALEEDEAPGIQVIAPLPQSERGGTRTASIAGRAWMERAQARNEADALRAEELVSTARAQLASGAKEQAEASCRGRCCSIRRTRRLCPAGRDVLAEGSLGALSRR